MDLGCAAGKANVLHFQDGRDELDDVVKGAQSRKCEGGRAGIRPGCEVAGIVLWVRESKGVPCCNGTSGSS